MRTAFLLAASSVFLMGCAAEIGNLVEDISETASGRITEVKDRVEQGIQPVTDTINDVNERVESVQEGAKQVQEGIEKLESAIGQ